ncbi:hypothetical protein NHQ30_000402 [Ciborinia camelliae]|nr:hypothetical protein NHQ30_000402 [Ciborinia camelliae]
MTIQMRNKHLFLTSTQRHQALLSRDPLAHSSFIYSVITTKIYCRPTCPSRLARRANIFFHESAEEAERDGFRACKRCRPDVDKGIMKNGEHNEKGDDKENLARHVVLGPGDDNLGEMGRGKRMVEKAMKLIEDEIENGGGKWTVKEMAKEVGLTESHFCRIFKKYTGGTVGEYRMKVMRKQLGETSKNNAIPRAGNGSFESEAVFNWDGYLNGAGRMDSPDIDMSLSNFDSTVLLDINADDGMEFLNFELCGD